MACHSLQPKRFGFSRYQQNALARAEPGKDWVGKISFPFCETITELFVHGVGLQLYSHKNGESGAWLSIKSEAAYTKIETWIRHQGTRIFLRDLLTLSVALGVNIADRSNGEYTRLGALEDRAKNQHDDQAIGEIVSELRNFISDTGKYRATRLIAAVPGHPSKEFDLPRVLAAQLAQNLNFTDLTPQFRFARSKQSLKNLPYEAKWDAWEAAGLSLNSQLQGNPTVILIDDKYQSGITTQFVASRLQAAGAGHIYGLYVVKTLRDDDNQR